MMENPVILLVEDNPDKLQDPLRHAQKMESEERLAGGIVHDFKRLQRPD